MRMFFCISRLVVVCICILSLGVAPLCAAEGDTPATATGDAPKQAPPAQADSKPDTKPDSKADDKSTAKSDSKQD
ncbi:MAG: hypothetical protein RRY20_08705, partial [Bilophila sp.]